jgi:hypothetical protein
MKIDDPARLKNTKFLQSILFVIVAAGKPWKAGGN